jgi:hypothetical protein
VSEVRIITPDDAPALEVVLAAHWVSSTIPARRPINGLLGPWDQAEVAVVALDLSAPNSLLDKPEILYAVDRDDHKTPVVLATGAAYCRRGVPPTLMLAGWRAAYGVAAMSVPNAADTLNRARDDVAHAVALGDVFVLEPD